MNANQRRVHWFGVVLAVVVGLCIPGGVALLFEAKGKMNVQRAFEAKAAPAGKAVAIAKPHAVDRDVIVR